ncbi:MAG: NAD(P)-dependent oxidoreductase [Alphaproteobacteria bacterium]|nr:NAD(P)-dependent oxidoreductase [Alphaproteobacteria bacterium]
MAATQNVIVTGGLGRLGKFVIKDLLRHGHRVTVVDLKAPPDDINFVRADIMDIAAVRKALAGADSVVHLAGYDVDFGYPDEEYIRVNVVGSWHVLQAASELGIPKVVLSSSIAACGLQDARPDHAPIYVPVDEKQPDKPRHPYSVSKKLVEEAALRVADAGKVSVIVLRPMMVLQPSNFVRVMTRLRDPNYRWLFYYVTPEDAAQAYRLGAEVVGVPFAVLFVGAADSCTPEPTLELVRRLWTTHVPVSKPEVYAANPNASMFDCSAAHRVLGYSATSNWNEIVRARNADGTIKTES